MKRKTWMAALLALLLALPCAMAETPDSNRAQTISLDANPSTGYVWTGAVLTGSAVSLGSAEGVFVPDAQADRLTGAGGRTQYVLTAARPGESLVVFEYARPWEDAPAGRRMLLAVVDQALQLTLTDVTDAGQTVSFAEATGLDAFLLLATQDNPIVSVSFTEGYSSLEPEHVTDALEEIQAILNAALAMQIGSFSAVQVTDWDPRLRVTCADGQSWSAAFNGHCLTRSGVNCNLIGDGPFWQLLSGLRRTEKEGK